ncbi:MAG TPA: polysaccharide deacetylase family protein, partial [Planctomycetaceae bacterium]|nr:polysaccharide deacetylase family protein [Planctomycetaceae bacterium]
MSHLIVTVDTEEEGLWGGRYRATGNTVENIQAIPRFQELCDRYGVRPTYLVDAPVVEDDRAAAVLGAIHDDGRCEIGAHVHPWCNPPFFPPHDTIEPDGDSANSFLLNLPEHVQRAKIEWLTEAIETRFGRRPTSFRAGRYGLDIVGARILAGLGYRVDSSVIPFTDYSAEGGPDFSAAPYRPYTIGEDDLCTPARPGAATGSSVKNGSVTNGSMATGSALNGSLLEVPVTVGYSRPNFERAHALRRLALRPWPKRFRAVGLLDRLGLARRIKFSPEQATERQLRQVIDACLANGTETLVLMLHSSSLAA